MIGLHMETSTPQIGLVLSWQIFETCGETKMGVPSPFRPFTDPQTCACPLQRFQDVDRGYLDPAIDDAKVYQADDV